MKLYVVLSCGLAFGLVVGMLVPREELVRLRREHRRAAISLSRCESGSQSAFDELFDVARPTSGSGRTTHVGEPQTDGGLADAPDAGVGSEAVAVVEEPTSEPTPDFSDGGMPPIDPDSQEAIAIDLRAHQARAALREQAGLDDAQMVRLDAIVAEMNSQLAVRVQQTIAAGHGNRGVVTRRQMMELAADGLDILMVSDDRIRALVGPEAAAEVEIDAIDPTSFVSSEAFRAISSARDLRLEGER